MPVRLRITLLFSLLVFLVLGIMCLSIYFFSVRARLQMVHLRLGNRAKTTAALLSQQELFTKDLVRRIDSFTTMSLKEKLVRAYDYQNTPIYTYKDNPAEEFRVDSVFLDDARVNGERHFILNGKDAVAVHYTDHNARLVVVAAGNDQEGRESLDDLKQILIVCFLAGNLVLLAAGYIFSGRLLKPIRKITLDVAEISAHDLERRLPVKEPRDEWYALAFTLNNLLDRLQESFDMQRRFIANASHEISTPLTSISSQLEVALQRDRTAEEYRKVMQSTYQDVKHMSRLTHTLLEFAKASGNPGGLELSDIRIDEVILELPAQLVKINPVYTVTLSFEDLPEEEEKLLVYGNKPLLETAIKNIAINACKYSDDHQAFISLKSLKDAVFISITDKGQGIPADKLDTIFQPFYRIDSNGGQNANGFGLGLSLSHRIIRLHNGTIEVESVVNQGSVFRIKLPVTLPASGF